MGYQHLAHRLVGHRGDRPAHLLAVKARRTGVDHQHAFGRDDETGIDDVAAVAAAEVFGQADEHIGIRRDPARLEQVVETGLDRESHCRQQQQRPAHGAPPVHCATRAWMRLPLLSTPESSSGSFGARPAAKSNVNTGFSLTGSKVSRSMKRTPDASESESFSI